MAQSSPEELRVYDFILQEIDSVPHLEALLLLWNTRPQPWSSERVGERIYLKTKVAQILLQDLSRQGFLQVLSGEPERYRYESSSGARDQVLALADAMYRRQVVRIATLIHSKASSAVLDFARAFRFTKDWD